ncbi:hypothetical protein NtRootA1_48480 [Arthrobacter sp. NtRootA1]|nr:hypothetical protein NtRootA1_48480 [Arthrobacter sp. NtRootA1]
MDPDSRKPNSKTELAGAGMNSWTQLHRRDERTRLFELSYRRDQTKHRTLFREKASNDVYPQRSRLDPKQDPQGFRR